MIHPRAAFVAGCLVLATAAQPLRAEILSIQGKVRATLTELLNGSEGDFEDVSEEFPGTSSELPIAAVAQLLANTEKGAGAVAAQFADPTELNQQNPEEFALNLAIASVDGERTYEALAEAVEIRRIQFQPSEFPDASEGELIQATGRFFLDGALVLLSADETRDLTGAQVALDVRVEQVGDNGGERFRGTLELVGGANGSALANQSGAIPTGAVTLIDLGDLNADFGRVWVLVLPPTAIDYDFEAPLSAEFQLHATITLTAKNLPDEVTCAAVVGTPVTAIAQVVALTEDDATANTLLADLSAERTTPSGDFVFAQPLAPGLCGLTGFGLVGLLMLRIVGLHRAAARRR